MAGSKVEIKGSRRAADRLRAIANRAKDPTPAMTRVAERLEDHVSLTFATDGAHVGRRWKMLSRDYEARKQATSTGGPLILSGGLRESFQGGSGHIERIRGSRMTWGTNHPLAHLHQDGTARKRVPARPMLVVTPELRRQVRRDFKGYILGR